MAGIAYALSRWGIDGDLEHGLSRIAAAGADVAVLRPPATVDEAERLRERAAARGLRLSASWQTHGDDADAHLASFRAMLPALAAMRPQVANSQTGSDFLAREDNARLIRAMDALAADAGLRLAHETHRSRATATLPMTAWLLEACPTMRLTADLSHWCCAHESLLEGRGALLAPVLERCIAIHARVGHAQGPQVADFRAPECRPALDAHLAWWDAIRAAVAARGEPLQVQAEFGPPGYLPTLPYTRAPVADQCELNAAMLATLRARWGDARAAAAAG